MRPHLKYLFLLLIPLFAFRLSLFAYKPSNDTIISKSEQRTTKNEQRIKKDTFIVRYYYRQSLDTNITPQTVKLNNSLDGFQIYDPAKACLYWEKNILSLSAYPGFLY